MRNILENPNVGLLLMLPGVEEVVRINGKATLTEDAALLAGSAVNGSIPALGIIVKIDDVFFHCAKAVIRSSSGTRTRPFSARTSRLSAKSCGISGCLTATLPKSMPGFRTITGPPFTDRTGSYPGLPRGWLIASKIVEFVSSCCHIIVLRRVKNP